MKSTQPPTNPYCSRSSSNKLVSFNNISNILRFSYEKPRPNKMWLKVRVRPYLEQEDNIGNIVKTDKFYLFV